MPNTTSRVPCHCGKIFKNSQALLQHARDSPRHQQTVPRPPATPAVPPFAAPSLKGKVTCTCGGVFKTDGALQQHQRDSSLHPKTDMIKRTGGLKGSCGRTVKDENGLKEHMRVSSRHRKLEEFCAAALNDGAEIAYGFPDDGAVGFALSYLARGYSLTIHSQLSYYPWNDDLPAPGEATALMNRPVAFSRGIGLGQEVEYTEQRKNKARQSHRVWSSSGDCYSDVGDDHSLCDKDCGWCGHCADTVFL